MKAVDSIVAGLRRSCINAADYSDFILSISDASHGMLATLNSTISDFPICAASFIGAHFSKETTNTHRLYVLLCCNPADVVSDLFYYSLIADLESKISIDVQIAGTIFTKESMTMGSLEVTLILSNGPSDEYNFFKYRLDVSVDMPQCSAPESFKSDS